MKNAVKFVKHIQFSKPEVILQSIPRHSEISVFSTKYKNYLQSLPKITTVDEIQSHVLFPYTSFNSFPKETLTKLMEESFEIIKPKIEIANRTHLYDTMIRNYIINQINFDVEALLQEMNECGVPFYKSTFKKLIKVYSRTGSMEKVENVIEAMNSNGIEIDESDKMLIAGGYIIARQSEKSKAYIKENNLNENDKFLLINEGQSYAILGDTEKVISIINKMKENNFDLVPQIYTFYRLLVNSNASESDLEQITNLIPGDNPKARISTLIFYLNRNGQYNRSLRFIEKYKDLLLDRNTVFNLLMSFNSKHCPINIYKSVLQLFNNHINLSQRNLFANMDHDGALKLSRGIINEENGNVILTSLLNKAISDKSVHSIKESLRFGIDNLRISKLNLQLQFGFIPSILESGMVSNCEELLNLLPEFKSQLLPCVFMYHLCKGDFSEYNNLIPYRNSKLQLYYSTYFGVLSMEIIRNIGFVELDKLALDASKIFSSNTVNGVLSSVIIDLIVNQFETNNKDFIGEIIKFGQKFNVTFTEKQINLLKKNVSDYAELFDTLSIRNYSAKSKTSGSETYPGDVD